ncbi:MAG: EamA family transporter [Verrucomicrobia bacterium]|nr:EamA family transporter [Deltaproteobacteria bacterium]
MTLDALILVVSGALLHAIWNFFAKKASGGLPFVWLYGIVSIAAAFPFGIASWFNNSHQFGTAAWVAIVASALVHVVYSLVLQRGYLVSDFSIVYPLARGTGPLFSIAGAMIFLAESPNLLGWLGITLIILGIFLISYVPNLHSASGKVLQGVMWGCLTGICIGLYTLIDGWAVKTLAMAPILYYVLGLGLRTIILAPQALSRRQLLIRQWRENKRYIMAVGILSPLAYTLVLFAMTKAKLSYVAPVREVSMLAGVFFGARVLREAFSRVRMIGMALMVAGVVLLAVAK